MLLAAYARVDLLPTKNYCQRHGLSKPRQVVSILFRRLLVLEDAPRSEEKFPASIYAGYTFNM